jgi:hypothetical protein
MGRSLQQFKLAACLALAIGVVGCSSPSGTERNSSNSSTAGGASSDGSGTHESSSGTASKLADCSFVLTGSEDSGIGAEPQVYDVLGTTKIPLFNVTSGTKYGASCSYDEGPTDSPGSVFSLRFFMGTGDDDIAPGRYDATTRNYQGDTLQSMTANLLYGNAAPPNLVGKGWQCHLGNDQTTDDLSFTVDSVRPLPNEYSLRNVHGHGHAVCPPNHGAATGTMIVDFEFKN